MGIVSIILPDGGPRIAEHTGDNAFGLPRMMLMIYLEPYVSKEAIKEGLSQPTREATLKSNNSASFSMSGRV